VVKTLPRSPKRSRLVYKALIKRLLNTIERGNHNANVQDHQHPQPGHRRAEVFPSFSLSLSLSLGANNLSLSRLLPLLRRQQKLNGKIVYRFNARNFSHSPESASRQRLLSLPTLCSSYFSPVLIKNKYMHAAAAESWQNLRQQASQTFNLTWANTLSRRDTAAKRI
jgi:hypothetical protein